MAGQCVHVRIRGVQSPMLRSLERKLAMVRPTLTLSQVPVLRCQPEVMSPRSALSPEGWCSVRSGVSLDTTPRAAFHPFERLAVS